MFRCIATLLHSYDYMLIFLNQQSKKAKPSYPKMKCSYDGINIKSTKVI